MDLQDHKDFVQLLSTRYSWGLTASQITYYMEFLGGMPALLPEHKTRVLVNFHTDHVIVNILGDEHHPDHSSCWEQINRIVLQSVQRLVGSHQYGAVDVDDLAQVTLELVNRGLPTFRHESRLTTWIYKIAVNVFLGYIRSRKTIRRGMETVSLDQQIALHDPRDHIQLFLALNELSAEITQTLAAADDQRLLLIFQLKILDDQRLADISAILKLSPARISALLKDAKQLLRDNPRLREAADSLGINTDNP